MSLDYLLPCSVKLLVIQYSHSREFKYECESLRIVPSEWYEKAEAIFLPVSFNKIEIYELLLFIV